MAISDMNDSPRLLHVLFVIYFCNFLKFNDGIFASLDVDYTFLARTTHF